MTSALSAFMFGTPYIIGPPIRSDLSYTVTVCPILLSSSAAASPAGPEPTTATVFVDLKGGGHGSIHPISYALSTIMSSMDLMLTASSMIPKVQAASHGAGQTRP